MSTPKTTFILSDGTPLTSVFPLESNGVGNLSVPNEILDVDTSSTGVTTITVLGDYTERFVSLIGTAFGGALGSNVITSNATEFANLQAAGLDVGVFIDIPAVSPETSSPIAARTKVTAIDFTAHTISLSSPLLAAITNRTVRFNTPFSIIDLDPLTPSPYIGEYGVQSCLYNNGASIITISSATPLVPATFDIADFAPGTNGSFTIQGVSNPRDVFYSSSKFTVSDTSATLPDVEFTVGSVVQSTTSAITDVVITASSTVLTVQGNVGDFFLVTSPQYQQLKVTSNTSHNVGIRPLNGTHEIINVGAYNSTSDTTTVTIATVISGTSGPANGLVAPAIPTTIITVTGAFSGDPAAIVPPTAGAYDVVKVGAPVARSFTAAPSITPTTPHKYIVTWYVAGDHTAVYAAGATITIKNNNYYSLKRLLVDSSSYDGTNTSVRTTISDPSSTTPVIGSSGSIVYPAIPVPYGHIQYTVLDVASPLQLVGRGVTHYNGTTTWGQALQNNSIHQLENFNNTTPPASPLEGQYWFNPTGPSMNIRSNGEWSGVVVAGMPVTANIDMNGNAIFNVADVDELNPDMSQVLNVASGDVRYVNASGDTMTGPLAMSDNPITGVATIDQLGADPTQALNVESGDLRYINVTGDAMAGELDMSGHHIGNVANPASSQDVATKSYVDSLASGIVWLQPVLDPNLFNDTLSTPPVLSDADMLYYRSYYVAPTVYNVSGVNDATQVWSIDGDRTSVVAVGDTFTINGNFDNTAGVVLTPANGVYTVASLSFAAGKTNIVTVEAIPSSATITGDLHHNPGAWNGKAGRVVAWNGMQWIDVLDRQLQIGDRFGVFFEVDNDEASVPNPGGSFGVGMPLGTATKSAAGRVVTVNAISDAYVIDWGTAAGATFPPHTPSEPDAISVLGVNSPHYGHSYTFRGTWSTGDYNYDYKWIEFAGPSMLVDGAGLKYTGNILNVGQGTGVTVTANAVSIDSTYMNSLYMRRDGSTSFTSDISMGNNHLVNLANPTTATSAINLQYAQANFMSLNGSSTMTNDLNLGGNQITNVGTPGAPTDAANMAYTDTKVAKSGDTMTGPLVMSSAGGLAQINMGNTNRIINLADPVAGADAINLQTADGRYVNITGDTMTGPLTLSADPTQIMHASTKQYVDQAVSAVVTSVTNTTVDGGSF